MTGERTINAAPPWAIPCWVDGHSLYFELRSPQGPIVVSFQRHELSRATAILFSTFETESHGEVYTRPPVEPTKGPKPPGLTDKTKAEAREALKALGLLK